MTRKERKILDYHKQIRELQVDRQFEDYGGKWLIDEEIAKLEGYIQELEANK